MRRDAAAPARDPGSRGAPSRHVASQVAAVRLPLLLLLACAVPRCAVGVHECVNGTWIHAAEHPLPDYMCDRQPVAINWRALTEQRCRANREDSDWDVQDPHLTRQPYWQSAAALFRHHLRNRTLWFVGDSVAHLWKTGLDCELWRHGFLRAPAAEAEAAGAALTRGVDFGPQSWLGYDFWVNTSTLVVFMGRNEVHRPAWERMLRPTDVVVFNYGLHYVNDTAYTEDMAWLLRRLARWEGTAVWRETGAQHFRQAAYNASLQASDDGTWTCGTSEAQLYSRDNVVWRRNLETRAAVTALAPAVLVLDFYNVTAARADLLEGRYCELRQQRMCLDCTHFTYTPQLYAALYHRLYVLLGEDAQRRRAAAASSGADVTNGSADSEQAEEAR